jgi:hypothetical protein
MMIRGLLVNTSVDNKKIALEGYKLKRVSITIQYKNNPENVVSGYALTHEILANQISFFAAQKFPVDEELTVFYQLKGEKKSLDVRMKHMHEQISSGRVMNALPTEENPFPARKFYRCYTSAVSAEGLTKTTTETTTQNAAATSETKIESPIEATAPAAEQAPIETVAKENKIDLFAAEEAPKIEIPEVGGIAPVEMAVEEPKAA